MTYEELLITLSGIEPEQALNELRENPDHKHKSGYEFIIKKDPEVAYHYAKDVIQGRWIEAEEVIKTDPFSACDYAEEVIGDKNFWDKN